MDDKKDKTNNKPHVSQTNPPDPSQLSAIQRAVNELQTWTVENVREYHKKRAEIIREMLRPGIDYGDVPGTDKKALRKPGIQNLARFAHFFGMPPVYCKYETTREEAEPLKEWEYQFTDKYTGELIIKQTRGFYRYRVRCELYTFGGNEFAGSAEGECCSVERGRETALGNTIWQMAKKRAFSQAVTDYTCTSDILTDEEAIEETAKRGGDARLNGLPKTLNSIKSRFGSEEEPSKCNFCGKSHIVKGMPIVQHPGPGDLKGKWGHADCYADLFREADTSTQSEDKAKPGISKPTEDKDKPPVDKESHENGQSDPIRDDLIKEIIRYELELSKGDKSFKIPDSREKYVETIDLNMAENVRLAEYHHFLKESIKE